MSELQLFVLPEELDSFLGDFAQDKGLLGCYCRNNGFALAEKGFSILEGGRVVSALFLLSPGQWSPNPRPRDLGWLHIRPGELLSQGDARILTLSYVAGEDRKSLNLRPSRWTQALRRRLAKTFGFGAEGKNTKFGGSHVYKDIGYSPGALELYEEGVQWKQFPDGNVEFNPASPPRESTSEEILE